MILLFPFNAKSNLLSNVQVLLVFSGKSNINFVYYKHLAIFFEITSSNLLRMVLKPYNSVNIGIILRLFKIISIKYLNLHTFCVKSATKCFYTVKKGQFLSVCSE